MILFHDHLTHARAANPVAKIYCIPISVVIIEFSESHWSGISPAFIRKFMPLALVPKVGDAAQKSPFKFMHAPKRLDPNQFTVRQPRAGLS
jgi:hypothetical protein